MEIVTIFTQLGILAILAICGVLGFRSKILSNESKSVLEKLVFYITLPLLIITSLSTLDITNTILTNGALILLFTYLILLFQIVVGKLSSKLLNLKQSTAVIHSLHTFLGNIVFLGFPLLDALFPGGEAILYAALYQLGMNTVLWTYGVSRLDTKSNKKGLKNLNKLLNPNTVALVLGLLMVVLKIKLPDVLLLSLGGLGKTTLYLAMLYIGILLAQSNIKKMFVRKDVLVLSFNKLILIPVLLIISFRLFFHLIRFELSSVAFSVLILEAAMPCMTLLVLFAKRYGADDIKAMENFVVTTILSILSLPLVIYMIELSK